MTLEHSNTKLLAGLNGIHKDVNIQHNNLETHGA
jgi:hypothetical protein